MRRLVPTAFCLAFLCWVVFYYSAQLGSWYALVYLTLALFFFGLNVIGLQLDMHEHLRRVPLSALVRRPWPKRFIFVIPKGLAPLRTTDLDPYLAEAKARCVASDGSMQSTQTISNESSETGLDQLRWDQHTSTITQSSSTDNESNVEQERIECSKDERPSTTSGSLKESKPIEFMKNRKGNILGIATIATLIFSTGTILKRIDRVAITTDRIDDGVGRIEQRLTAGLSKAKLIEFTQRVEALNDSQSKS